jgi:hypothetical protein
VPATAIPRHPSRPLARRAHHPERADLLKEVLDVLDPYAFGRLI